MQLTFPDISEVTAASSLAEPEGYRGLYAFHKYWGKKPAEPIRYLIQHLCPPKGLVVDPFLGSGISALEAVQLKRRVIGIDLNPAAIRISRLLIAPPSTNAVAKSFASIRDTVRDTISESYSTIQGKPATHFVWSAQVLQKVWVAPDEGRTRQEMMPSDHDLALISQFSDYQPRRLRQPRFFTNSRINSTASLRLTDLFTCRALRNIELVIDAIDALPKEAQEAMRLCLTAAVGQMSRMVFAITGRGKTNTNGRQCERMEVGSWVIGYWRPEQHFEVNVWNCFERRVKKLIGAIAEASSAHITAKSGDLDSVCVGASDYALVNGNTLEFLPRIPDASVDLIITDPPHSDRIPYLELSELWNVILGEEPSFESEIVVSNAKERGKKKLQYNQDMTRFLEIAGRKLRDAGFLVLFFNARTEASWKFLENFSKSADNAGIPYCGCFPLVYSAASVVQDNRAGALRTDFGLVFSRSAKAGQCLQNIPGWLFTMPSLGQ